MNFYFCSISATLVPFILTLMITFQKFSTFVNPLMEKPGN